MKRSFLGFSRVFLMLAEKGFVKNALYYLAAIAVLVLSSCSITSSIPLTQGNKGYAEDNKDNTYNDTEDSGKDGV